MNEVGGGGSRRSGEGGSRFTVAEVGRGGRERIVNVKTRTISKCYANRCGLDTRDSPVF